ncbi:MAG: hypothetical protein DMG31_19005 [Acidobacteria bacterium]|nr:MAG: hypothetical protein DMG31_19005 [Acidobacteriota bacterium]
MSDMSVYQFHSEAARRDRQRAIFRIMLCFVSLLVFQPKGKAAQAATPGPPGRQEVIGRLSGDDVSVNGAIGFETENGRTMALLASGSDLTLRSGEAKIDLPEGGDIILCGPAHLSILKSGPAITIALDYGQVHLQIGPAAQVTIYTPLLIVTPVVIGDRGRDLTVGLDQKGELCVMALSGAMRIEEQFTGASLIVPQGGDVQIEAGELRTLRNGSRTCSCELLVSQNNTQKQIELSVPAHPSPSSPSIPRAPQPINPPAYRIDMPPLTFDASSPAPPPLPSPEAMLIIRESVADPAISFRGAVNPALPPPPGEVSSSGSRSHNSRLRFFAKLFGIFHHHRAPASEQSAAARP